MNYLERLKKRLLPESLPEPENDDGPYYFRRGTRPADGYGFAQVVPRHRQLLSDAAALEVGGTIQLESLAKGIRGESWTSPFLRDDEGRYTRTVRYEPVPKHMVAIQVTGSPTDMAAFRARLGKLEAMSRGEEQIIPGYEALMRVIAETRGEDMKLEKLSAKRRNI